MRFDEDIQDLPTSLSFVYTDINDRQLFPLIFNEVNKLLPFIKEALDGLEHHKNTLVSEDIERNLEESNEELMKPQLGEKKCIQKGNYFELPVTYI